MDTSHQPGEPRRPSILTGRRTALMLGGLALLVVCGAAAYLALSLLLVPGTGVSQTQEQIAQTASPDPALAPLHLGHYGDIDGWLKAGPTDYAVQDGLVIFRAPRAVIRSPWDEMVVGDVKLPALVYAPDGRDVSLRPDPPPNRTWIMGDEWFLYGCHAIPGKANWWSCTLSVSQNL